MTSAPVSSVQGTVASFDPATGEGSAVLDNGTRVPFSPSAFAASGLRLLRPGQRVRLEHDAGQAVIRVTLLTME
jgi:cold shock CspA family protein